MHNIKIKALSVNKAWKGRKFKTNDYKNYETELFYLLPNIKVPAGKLELNVIVGCSSSGSDIDNLLKPFIDVMQKKYNFNDNNIYKLSIEKIIVKKKMEFIKFKIEEL